MMLVIRQSQMEVFEKVTVQRFEDSLLEHLRIFFPQHAVVLGDTQMRRVLRYGLQRAESRKLETERGFYLYLALMFMLGSNFDEDIQLPWMTPLREISAPPSDESSEKDKSQETSDPSSESSATEIPTKTETVATGESDQSPSEEKPEQKAPESADICLERLYGQAMTFLDQTVGTENGFLQQTLGLMKQSQILETVPNAPSFGHRLLLLLQTLAPNKYQMLGQETLHDFVRTGYESAKQHNITTEQGMMHYIALMFVLGSHFDRDPLYPWATTVLSNPDLNDSSQRDKALRQAAQEYLSKYLPACPQRAKQSEVALARADKPYKRVIEDS